MTIIYNSNKKIITYPLVHDTGDSKYYSFVYRPVVRADNKEYLVDAVVMPNTANGYYYVCINAGVTGATAPVYAAKEGGKTTDGTVIWQAKAYSLMVNTGDSITTSTFTSDTGVTISDIGLSDGITSCKVALTGTLTSFTLTNTITILRASGKSETFDRSLLINVAEL